MKSTGLSFFAFSHLLLAINLAHADWHDKEGQGHVTAADGSEYTGSLWTKGRIRFVRRACERRDEAGAPAALGGVSGL
jgi:hypothetical protein